MLEPPSIFELQRSYTLIKAVLIEDEILIRENIRESFPWSENGIVFAGEAGDGETALQLIEDVDPQIVITDIKMPFLNGLDLSRIILAQMPWVKVIIMTGFDDFELAQQALKIGVSDYLLKPIVVEELRSSLQKVVKEISLESRRLQDIESLQAKMEINKRFLQHEFLNNVVAGALSVTEVFEKSTELGISIQAKAYAVILVSVELSVHEASLVSKELIQAGSIIESLQADDLYVIRSSLKEYILLIKSNNPKYLVNDCYRMSQSIKKELEKKTKVSVSVSIGGVKQRVQDIQESYEEAKETETLSYLFGKHKVVGLEDARLLNPYQGAKTPFERREISRFLRSGSKEEIPLFIEEQQKRFDRFPINPFFITLVRFNLFYEITLFLEEIGYLHEFNESHPLKGMLQQDDVEHTTLTQLLEQATTLIDYAVVQREQQKIRKYEFVIQKAKQYIEANYHKRTLQLADVAQHVHMSTSHLSTIFNQETGMGYTDYVGEVRIAKAKDLLANNQLRSAEIAYMVGFSDPHYFYNIFKKVTGMTSGAYRQSLQNNS
jgi:two-component system response regulator YesN